MGLAQLRPVARVSFVARFPMHESIRSELETSEVKLLLKKTLVNGRGRHAEFFGFHNLRHGVTERWRREEGHEEQTFIQSLLRRNLRHSRWALPKLLP